MLSTTAQEPKLDVLRHTDVLRGHLYGVKIASVAVFLVWSSTACAQAPAPEDGAARECASQIRLRGTTYTGAGYTEVRGTQFSSADQADCEDVGPSPRGPVFSERSEQVAVWALPGYSTEEVVTVRFNEDSFTIFVADSVPRGEIDRIVRELSSSQR
jgi:hypothetical protein